MRYTQVLYEDLPLNSDKCFIIFTQTSWVISCASFVSSHILRQILKIPCKCLSMRISSDLLSPHRNRSIRLMSESFISYGYIQELILYIRYVIYKKVSKIHIIKKNHQIETFLPTIHLTFMSSTF